jgi:hypothetical protein
MFNYGIDSDYADINKSIDKSYVNYLSTMLDEFEELIDKAKFVFDYIQYQKCNFCNKESKDNKRCSRCKSVWYCDEECQRKDWTQHKKCC